jgi:hypothetical protein
MQKKHEKLLRKNEKIERKIACDTNQGTRLASSLLRGYCSGGRNWQESFIRALHVAID